MITTRMEKTKTDLTPEAGAAHLARQIVRYWKERGSAAIMAVPVAISEQRKSPIGKQGAPWGIVSNLAGNGFPPDCRKE